MTKLEPLAVEKPWGRTRLPSPFGPLEGRRIGEIWFPAPANAVMPILAKYLFTSEALSIQVHPTDEQARAGGLPAGKEECWFIRGGGAADRDRLNSTCETILPQRGGVGKGRASIVSDRNGLFSGLSSGADGDRIVS